MSVHNTAIIIGPAASLNEFYQTLNTVNRQGNIVAFSFHQTIPIKLSNKIDLGSSAGDTEFEYMMKKNHWGSYSDAILPQILIRSETEFMVKFATEETAPSEWARRVIINHPQLTLKLASNFTEDGYYQVETFKYLQRTRYQYDISSEDSLAVRMAVQGQEGDDMKDPEEILNPNSRYAEFLQKYHLL